MFLFFFFKQKTAYEMRISDWSSDVCSSDLRFTGHNDFGIVDHFVDVGDGQKIHIPLRVIQNDGGAEVMLTLFRQPGMDAEKFAEIGRASCRERVCQYV